MDESLIKPLSREKNNYWSIKSFIFFLFFIIIIGGVSGYIIESFFKLGNQNQNQKNFLLKKKEAADKKIFHDQAEGVLREGGIDGEGSFHLERPGGKSQNVYLTSSTIDLSRYLGKKVRVYGETFAAEKAGWLMDVGLVEIIK